MKISVLFISLALAVFYISATVNAEGACIDRPSIPFNVGGLENKLSEGSKISVTGTFNSDAKYLQFFFYGTEFITMFRMTVNFTAQQVVFDYNTDYSGPYVNPEIRVLGPFVREEEFVVDILVTGENTFSVSVNEEEFFTFTSQSSVDTVNSFKIDGKRQAVIQLVTLDGKDVSKANGAAADITGPVSIGDKVFIDMTVHDTPDPFVSVIFCKKDVRCRKFFMFPVPEEEATNADGSLKELIKGKKYTLQFDFMEDKIQMTVVNEKLTKATQLRGLAAEAINYVIISGAASIECIRFQPSA